MKYVVSRASNWDDEKQPCEEAVKETVLFVDERTVDDPSKIQMRESRETWYSDPRYFNHRVENGHIKRDHNETVWVIEIPTLEDLHKFMDKYGSVILDKDYVGSALPHLTIYDDWVE